MRRVLLSGMVFLVSVAGCSTPDQEQEARSLTPSERVGPSNAVDLSEATFIGTMEISNVTASEFDAVDVRNVRKMRDAWSAAFAAGDAEPVEFMFTHDAHFFLPEHPDLPDTSRGDTDFSAAELFERYNAELVFTNEDAELFSSVGGFRDRLGKLPWVSWKANYTVSLTPKNGGETVERSARFITRFRRQADDSLRVARGPRVGDAAPDFTLELMKGGEPLTLSSLRGKPTVLIFGSYT